MTSRSLRKSTRDLFKRLCEEIPLPLPITLIAHTEEEAVGRHLLLTKGKRGPRHVIRLRPGMDEIVEHETLVHEYAHAMSFSYPGQMENAVWGIAYSEAYSVVFGDH